MATTTYAIFAGDTLDTLEQVASKGKKAQAITLAESIRRDEKRCVRVVTSGGTVVLEMKARKKQIKTKAYTRVVALPEGFVVPETERVAYLRTRKSCAITHTFEDAYRVRNLATGDVLATFDTTRACGRFLADHVNAEGVVTAS